jgi:hypothetical protein
MGDDGTFSVGEDGILPLSHFLDEFFSRRIEFHLEFASTGCCSGRRRSVLASPLGAFYNFVCWPP